MLRSHHITIELARERHRDLVGMGSSPSPAGPDSAAQAAAGLPDRLQILAVVRGEAAVGAPAAEVEHVGPVPFGTQLSARRAQPRRVLTDRRHRHTVG